MSPRTARKAGKKTVKKAARRKTVTDATDKHTIGCIDDSAGGLHQGILKKRKPELTTPVRSLSNVRFNPKVGYLEIGRSRKVRTLTVNTVKSFSTTITINGDYSVTADFGCGC